MENLDNNQKANNCTTEDKSQGDGCQNQEERVIVEGSGDSMGMRNDSQAIVPYNEARAGYYLVWPKKLIELSFLKF